MIYEFEGKTYRRTGEKIEILVNDGTGEDFEETEDIPKELMDQMDNDIYMEQEETWEQNYIQKHGQMALYGMSINDFL